MIDTHYYSGDGDGDFQQRLEEINAIQMLRCKKAPHLAGVTLKKRWVTTFFLIKSSNNGKVINQNT